MKTGEFIRLHVRSVNDLINSDEELVKDFKNNRNRKLLLKQYVVKFNERNAGK